MKSFKITLLWIAFPLIFYGLSAAFLILFSLYCEKLFPIFPINNVWGLLKLIFAICYWPTLFIFSAMPVVISMQNSPNKKIASFFALPFVVSSAYFVYLFLDTQIDTYKINVYSITLAIYFIINFITAIAALTNHKSFND